MLRDRKEELRRLIARDELKAIVFDLDGTLTTVPSPWRLIHEEFGTWERAVLYHDRFFAGEIDYREWSELDISLWHGHSLAEIRAILGQITPRSGALALLRETALFRTETGQELAILVLSSGFDEVGARLLRDAELTERVTLIANGLTEEAGRIRPQTRVALRDAEHDKPAHLARFFARHHLVPHHVVAIDDRADDEKYFSELALFWHVQDDPDLLDFTVILSRNDHNN